MGNPDYARLLPLIAAETDSDKKQALIDECYVFAEPLTQEQEDLFAYMSREYVVDNPDSDGLSYVGKYFV